MSNEKFSGNGLSTAEQQYAVQEALEETTNELEARIFQLSSLRQVGDLFENTNKMEDVVTKGLEILLGVTPAERGSIMIYLPHSEELCLLAAGSRDGGQVVYFGPKGRPETAFHVGEGVAGACIADGYPILASDVKDEPRFISDLGGIQVGSLACMPLQNQGKRLGVVNLSHSIPGGLTPKELPLLSVLSSYLGIALSNAQLMEQLKDANADLEEKIAKRTAILEETNLKLRNAQKEIETKNQELQGKVEARTAELEQALETLKVHAEGLERANRAKDEFLNNINHELKTPLNSIIGYAGLLRKEAGAVMNDSQKFDLELIESNGRHLELIIENIFSLREIEGGDVKLQVGTTDFDALVRLSVASVLPRAREKGLEIVTDISSDLGTVVLDPTLIRRAIYNLLDNAVKYSDKGTIEVRTYLEMHGDGSSYATFSVKDQGRGIKASESRRIFDKFYQGEDAVRMQANGSGVGLTIALNLVALHGGELSYQPNSDGGSIFTFTIPC